MYKIAVCLYGQPRNFEIGYQYLSKCLEDHDVDYFLHLWFNEEDVGKDLKIYSQKQTVKSDTIKPNTKEKILELYRPKKHIIEKQRVFEKDIELENNHNRPPKTHQPSEVFKSMLYSRFMAVKLLNEYINKTDTQYDTFILTRTDFAPLVKLTGDIEEDTLYLSYVPGSEWNTTHINDLFVLSRNIYIIEHFTSLWIEYKQVFNTGIDYCAHRLTMQHMKNKYDKFKTLFGNNWKYVRNNILSNQ